MPGGEKCVALITTDGVEYSALAVFKKGRPTSSFENVARLSWITRIEPIIIRDLTEKLRASLRPHALSRFDKVVGEFPETTAHAIIQAIANDNRDFVRALGIAAARVSGRSIRLSSSADRRWEFIGQERDAVDAALSIAGQRHANVGDVPIERSRPAPFLQLLAASATRTISEDAMIAADAAVFGGLERLGTAVHGSMVFNDARTGSHVTVMNVNRQDLEHTLGVDLIIYHQRFRSYTMVQYKRLHKEPAAIRGGLASYRYRPSSDQNFIKEVERMRSVRSELLSQTVDGVFDYRLFDDPFFFKFCRCDAFDPDATGMIRGLHLPARDVEHFLTSPASRGPSGGHYLGFDNVKRVHPNSQFINLVRNGWVGSRSTGTQVINRVIAEMLELDHSVMLAYIGVAPSDQHGDMESAQYDDGDEQMSE